MLCNEGGALPTELAAHEGTQYSRGCRVTSSGAHAGCRRVADGGCVMKTVKTIQTKRQPTEERPPNSHRGDHSIAGP